MGCKFSFKRVFLVASLALAGLFGISSIFVSKQAQDNPVAEEANAAPDSAHQHVDNVSWKQEQVGELWYRIIYVHTHSSWQTNGRFGSGGSSDTDWHYEYKSPTNSNPSKYTHIKIGYSETSGGITRSTSEVLGDFTAKLYLPTDATYLRIHTNTYNVWPLDYYEQNKMHTSDISLTSGDTLTKWSYWIDEDNYSSSTTSNGDWMDEDTFFGRFYNMYFHVGSSWNGGNSALTSGGFFIRCRYSKKTDAWGIYKDEITRGTPLTNNMSVTIANDRTYAKFLVPKDCAIVYIASAFNTNDNADTGDRLRNESTTVFRDDYVYWVLDTASPKTIQYVPLSLLDGFYLYGSFNEWNTTEGLIRLTEYETGKYKVDNTTITADTQLKLGQILNHAWYHDYGYAGSYSPFPQMYTIEMGDKGGGATTNNFKIVTAGSYTIEVWDLNEESANDTCRMGILPTTQPVVQFTINDGTKQSMEAISYGIAQESQTYKAIYSSTSKINPAKGDVIKYYVNGVLFDSTIPESSASNSISGSAGDLYVNSDLLEPQNLIFETTVSSYVAYMGGHRGVRTSSFEGIISGTYFYVTDYSWEDSEQGIANTWSYGSSITWIRFYDPLGCYDDANQEAWMNFGSTIGGGTKKSSTTVPQYDGKDVAWSKVELFRCASGSSQPNPNDSTTYWNKSNNTITISNTNINGVVISEYAKWSFNNCYFSYNTDSTSGLEAGDSLYIKDAGGWLEASTHLYCYFYNPVGTTGDATSAAATLIPYSESKKHDNYYELKIPGAAGVKWRAVILLTSTDGTFEHKTHQSSDILVTSESKAKCQYLETGQNSLRYIFTDEDRSDCFVAHFLDVVNYGICKNYDGYSSNLEALQAVWVSDLKADFDKMDSRASAHFENADASPVGTDLEKAASTYDFVVKKYNKNNLVDFASRDGVSTSFSSYPFSINYILGNTDSSNMSIILIIIASSISILSITALSVLLVKKRNSQ